MSYWPTTSSQDVVATTLGSPQFAGRTSSFATPHPVVDRHRVSSSHQQEFHHQHNSPASNRYRVSDRTGMAVGSVLSQYYHQQPPVDYSSSSSSQYKPLDFSPASLSCSNSSYHPDPANSSPQVQTPANSSYFSGSYQLASEPEHSFASDSPQQTQPFSSPMAAPTAAPETARKRGAKARRPRKSDSAPKGRKSARMATPVDSSSEHTSVSSGSIVKTARSRGRRGGRRPIHDATVSASSTVLPCVFSLLKSFFSVDGIFPVFHVSRFYSVAAGVHYGESA